ncbi:MAG: trypsin-like peptidase domain-containing protein [Lachnospiraceae bacterium]|nr:trypsin-like peptidase domain-containing protein [Lachnospiraceae bacterium]
MENRNGLKKMGGSLVGGLIFGLVAGMIIIVMLSVFMPSLKNEAASEDVSAEAVAEAETEQEENNQSEETEVQKEEETVDFAGAEIQAADSAKEEQTVVTDVTKVVEQVMPCVVSIFGTYAIEDSFFGYYDYEAEGGGSGIIIAENESELLIVTNNHVVEDTTEMTVQFIDDSVAEARVKGTDPDMDLAVIAVDMDDLDPSTKKQIRVAILGDSDALKVGEPAIAIGNALGYGQSVTTGVISAVNRSYTDEEGPLYGGNLDDYDPDEVKYLIQTDAAINPGNSGGALLNVRGEVVGINSSKIADYTIEGMGYAIPISTAAPIIEELMTKRTRPSQKAENRAYLGISGMEATENMLERYDLSDGIYITQVFDDTPAKKAGIRKGDILIAIEGETVADMDELGEVLEYYDKGDRVTIQMLKRSNRGYREEEIEVVLGGRE